MAGIDTLFDIDQEVLESVGAESMQDVDANYITFQPINSKKDLDSRVKYAERSGSFVVGGLPQIISQKYQIPYDQVELGWSVAVYELLINSFEHGPEDMPITIASFYGPSAIGFGIHDGGGFYLQKETKQLLENRVRINNDGLESPMNLCISGRNHGIDILYEESDFIKVDNRLGVLYFTFDKEKARSTKTI